jgi:dTDP-4-dehydrorhamnose reductase
MSRVLILGGNGMIGHSLYVNLKKEFEVFATFQGEKNTYANFLFFDTSNCFYNHNALETESFKKILKDIAPDYVVNCIGVTKQLTTSSDMETIISINCTFPKKMSLICNELGVKFIHLSTDCVFSGSIGNYTESSIPDPVDYYGVTKFLSEFLHPSALILRKSTIGLELGPTHGLIEWFLDAGLEIDGYKNAIYSGLTTKEFSRAISCIIRSEDYHAGLFNLASTSISKFDLLSRLSDRIFAEHSKIININTDFKCNRSLNSLKFNKMYDFQSQSWDQMLDGLCKEILQRNSQLN